MSTPKGAEPRGGRESGVTRGIVGVAGGGRRS